MKFQLPSFFGKDIQAKVIDSYQFAERVHKMSQDARRWENEAKEYAIMWCMNFLEMDVERGKRHLQLQEQPLNNPNSLSPRDYYFRVVYLPTKTVLKELRFTTDPFSYINEGKFKIKMEVTA